MPREKIKNMLAAAYGALGVNEQPMINRMVRRALGYLDRDREHYIEVSEPGEEEYLQGEQKSLICKMVPLAQGVRKDYRDDKTVETTTVLLMTVTQEDICFVLMRRRDYIYQDPLENVYGFPTYRFLHRGMEETELRVMIPNQILPAATARQREIYGTIFMAFVKYCMKLELNAIPRKTEQAMVRMEHSNSDEILLDGELTACILVPLAYELLWEEELREDHRYSSNRSLYLLIDSGKPRYVLKKHCVYRYFRKVIVEDAPGGCIYEPTEEKEETEYKTVTLDECPEKMEPLYG